MKSEGGSFDSTANSRAATYTATRTGMWRTRAAAMSNDSTDSGLTLDSMDCSGPSGAAMSSENMA
jgi:hypothetical protein